MFTLLLIVSGAQPNVPYSTGQTDGTVSILAFSDRAVRLRADRMAAMSTERSLESITAEDFQGSRGSRFRLTGGSPEGGSGEAFEAELAEVTKHTARASDTFRAPFSILFHGPLQPVMPQGIYRVEHEQLDAMDLFLVPVGPDEPPVPGQAPTAMRYEAVFG